MRPLFDLVLRSSLLRLLTLAGFALALLLPQLGCATTTAAPETTASPAPVSPSESAAESGSEKSGGESDAAALEADSAEADEETPAAGEATATLDLDACLPMDPAVSIFTLDNGLTVYLRENRKPESRAELRLAVNAGSILEDDDQQGLAHFLEHMAFNGTKNFEREELVAYLQSIGLRFGADINAATSFDDTIYRLTVPTDDPQLLATGIQVLGEWAKNISFETEDIERERGVVLEEWRAGRGAQARLNEQHFPTLLESSRYAERLPIGKPEILRTAPREVFVRFYEDWYRPDLAAVVAVGDFDGEQVESWIRQHLEGPWRDAEREVRERAEYSVPKLPGLRVSIATDPEMPRTSVSVYSFLEDQPLETVGDYRRTLVETLYHYLLNARLSELTQRPEPPFIYAGSAPTSLTRTRGAYVQTALARDGDLASALAAVQTEVRRVALHGFTASELDRAQRLILRTFEQVYEERDTTDSGAFAGEYVGHFLEEEALPSIGQELELVRQLLPTVTLEEVNRQSQLWAGLGEQGGTDRVVLVSAPESSAESLPSQDDLAALFATAAASNPEPWDDRTLDRPLLAELPTAGSIVAESTIDSLGITEWTLSNGIRVILKPTTFRSDEVQLTAVSPGGISLASDEEQLNASFADTVATLSGIGAFDRVQLDKALTDKVAGVSPSIGELTEGFNGGGSPRDLETIFQLVHLWGTEPRLDENAVEAYLGRLRSVLENRRTQPSSVFAEELVRRITQDHPRRQPLEIEDLDTVDAAAALDFYRQRYADFSDFLFVLVGNLDLDALRPLVTTYLASLPAEGRMESARDLEIFPPSDPVRFSIEAGLEPRAQARIVFHGEVPWTAPNRLHMSVLEEILSNRLRQAIREDRAGTYNVQVAGSLARRPRETYRVDVAFTADPEAIDSLVDEIFATVETIRAEGPTAEDLDTAREALLRARQTNLESNGFWLGSLAAYYRNDLDPTTLLAYPKRLEALTPEDLRQAANLFLVDQRTVVGFLRPEAAEEASAADSGAENDAEIGTEGASGD
ncbi:MAG: insulinase family protein [Acidobacteriota bacterium]